MLVYVLIATASTAAIDVEGIIEEAKKGTLQAQKALGQMYLNGQGVLQDYDEAARWLELAARQGDSDAQFDLGLLFLEGFVTKKDESDAEMLFKQAAQSGNEIAKIFAEAVQGSAAAQFKVYRYYCMKGNLDTAIVWLEKAIKNGSPEAHYDYGTLYALGDIGKNHSNLITDTEIRQKTQDEWYRKSAWLGYYEGQRYVAERYLSAEKYIEAYAWANIAAINYPVDIQGSATQPSVIRDRAAKNLNNEQIKEAQELAKKIDKEIKNKLRKN